MVNKLTDGNVAYQYAGFDTNFLLFKLYTRPIVDTKTGETGDMMVECHEDFAAFEANRDRISWLRRRVGQFLNKAVASTGVPVEQWIVEFSPVMVKYNIPSHLFLNSKRDQHFLSTGVIL
jgi:hypothetical protein